MPRIKVNDINLYYELQGPEEADVVVLSNGIFMSTASWGFQVAALKEHFRVLTYDCRGMWQSDHPAGPYSMELHADDLAGLLSNLGISRAHIAGISYGGEVSMTFAIKYPQMTRTLILSSVVSQIDPLLRAIGEAGLLPCAPAMQGCSLMSPCPTISLKDTSGQILPSSRQHGRVIMRWT